MTPRTLARLSDLYDEALEQPAEAREVWLGGLAGEDALLVPRLRAMFARAGDPDATDVIGDGPRLGPTRDGGLARAGDDVGPYRLLREIGAGGMGTVWLAERADGQLKRQVALKLPRLGWAPGLAERFAREREILATLEHPNIARLYDAGIDERGRPFMALEYVDGQPLDAYVRARSIDVRHSLALLLQVADAVAFAHARLVLHRDLKPGNVLVTSEGQVRLLDFGIAKLMAEGGQAHETALTQLGGRALTLDYASPEQIRGEPIGTASDVYSLGVMAYELLAGVRPYRLKRGTAAEIEEAITAQDVPAASTVAETPRAAAALKGDLDAILNKALKKDLRERYATVDAFAADLRRHVQGERVLARPDSLGYRARRFALRYRLPLAAAAIVVAAFGLAVGLGATALVIGALLAGLGAALWQARVAREQARQARMQMRIATSVQEFLEAIFQANSGDQPDPLRARQRTAKELLDEGATRIDRALADAPAAKLQVFVTMAKTYGHIEEARREVELLRQALSVCAAAFPGDSAERAATLAKLAMALLTIGDDDEAAGHLEEAEAILGRRYDDSSDSQVDAVQMARLEIFHRRHDVRGLGLAAALVARLRRRPPSYELLGALLMHGTLSRHAGDARTAVRLISEALELAPRMPGGAASGLATLYVELGASELAAGDVAAAEGHLRAAVAQAERNSGEGSDSTLILMSRLGTFLASRGRLAEASSLMAMAHSRLALLSPARGRAHARQGVLDVWATVERLLGHPERALALHDAVHAMGKDRLGKPRVLSSFLAARSETLIVLGRLDAAQSDLDQAERLLQARNIPPAPALGGQFAWLRATLALARGDALPPHWRRYGDVDRVLGSAAAAIDAERLLAIGDAAAAAARASAALGEAPLPGADLEPFHRMQLQLVMARALVAQGQASSAKTVLHSLLADDARICDAAMSPRRLLALATLVQACSALGDFDGARQALQEARDLRGRHREIGPQFDRALGAAESTLG